MYQIVATKEVFSCKRYHTHSTLIIDDFLEPWQSVEDFKEENNIKSKINRFTDCVVLDMTSDTIELKAKEK